MKKMTLTLFVLPVCLAVSSLCAHAAPSGASVAEGYSDWTGVELKNRIMGRVLSASDFRHRVTVFVVFPCDPKDEEQKMLGDFLRATKFLSSLQPSLDWNFDFEMEEKLPRDVLVVGVIQGKCTAKMLSAAMRTRSDENEQESPVGAWRTAAFYMNVKMVNGPDSEDKYPYVYVMGPSGKEPRWKGVYAKDAGGEIAQIVSKAKGEIGEWTPLTGVVEAQFFKKEQQELLSGKPVQGVVVKLKKGLTDADAEKAKEAQVMYDAVSQYRSDLFYRIQQEYREHPARAFVDVHRLITLFPQEKKNLQDINAKLKANKAVGTIGKMFEKVCEWNRPDFVFKNASEAKKAVQLVNTWRKSLEKISNDQTDTGLAGEASLILAQVDVLSETLLTKVPQK